MDQLEFSHIVYKTIKKYSLTTIENYEDAIEAVAYLAGFGDGMEKALSEISVEAKQKMMKKGIDTAEGF